MPAPVLYIRIDCRRVCCQVCQSCIRTSYFWSREEPTYVPPGMCMAVRSLMSDPIRYPKEYNQVVLASSIERNKMIEQLKKLLLIWAKP